MTEQDAREDLQKIKTMLERTRRATAESGTLFIVWGVLITLALIGNFVLGSLELYKWEWLNWAGIAVVGWIYSVIYGIRKERSEKATTYVQIALRHVYFACGTGFILVGIAFPALGVYSHEAIPILIAAVTGVLFFVMGGIFEWPILKGFGLFWWVGAVGLSLIRGDIRTLVYVGLFVVGFLVPAILLRVKYRKDQGR